MWLGVNPTHVEVIMEDHLLFLETRKVDPTHVGAKKLSKWTNVIKLRICLTLETLTRYYSCTQDNCTQWSCTSAGTTSGYADVTSTGRTY